MSRGLLGAIPRAIALGMLVVALWVTADSSAQAAKFVHGVVVDDLQKGRDVEVNRSSAADGFVESLGESTDGCVYVVQGTAVRVYGVNGEFCLAFGGGVGTEATSGRSVTRLCWMVLAGSSYGRLSGVYP